uniref:Uncharacterized protein n=1 Tax=Scophthalmus maximus TaxID=52904 RepID=A0A8D3BG67_SCOMX
MYKKKATAGLGLLEQLEDGQDDVVNVAEARGLGLLGVVQSARPVDGDVRLLLVELHCSKLAELKQRKRPLTSLHLFAVLGHVVRSDGPQELDVVVAVVFGHLFAAGFVWPLEPIVEKQVVRHADPVGFHGMALAIVVVPHVALKRNDRTDIIT